MLMSSLYGKKIALISTVPYFMVSQLSYQIRKFASLGIHVTIITSPGEELFQLPKHEHIRLIETNIPRKLALWGDLKAAWNLYRIFKREKFDILHSFTPKAGLLCAMSGFLAEIPLRFHTFTGQAWVTRQGVMRSVMRFSDWCISLLMTHCYADSQSQRDFLIAEHLATHHNISVIGEGALGGVDLERFSLKHYSEDVKQKYKAELGIADASCIYIYIGRLTVDKGLYELLDAFSLLQQESPQVHLLLVGPTDSDGQGVLLQAKKQKHVHCLGYQQNPEKFLCISDVFCLPSYREGFGTVVIEAGAMGVPCVGTKIPGLVDAILDGETGILVPVRDSEALHGAMNKLMYDKDLREAMGSAAHMRATQYFDSNLITQAWINEYMLQSENKL